MPTNKCEKHKAILDLQVKILTQGYKPIFKEKQELKAKVIQLENKLIKYELMNYGISIIAIAAILFFFKKTMKLKYSRQLTFDLNNKTDE